MVKKILSITAAVLLTGCLGFTKKADYTMVNERRETPVYFLEGETTAAFKAHTVFRGLHIDGMLLLQKLEDGQYRVRILGPMGSKVVDMTFNAEGEAKYDFLLPDFDSNIVKNRFEKCAMLLALKPGEIQKVKVKKDDLYEIKRRFNTGYNLYRYQYDNAYPHSLTNGSVHFEYSDYRLYKDTDEALPFRISYTDTLADLEMELFLIGV